MLLRCQIKYSGIYWFTLKQEKDNWKKTIIFKLSTNLNLLTENLHVLYHFTGLIFQMTYIHRTYLIPFATAESTFILHKCFIIVLLAN